MTTNSPPLRIREGTPADDALLAEHFLLMWRDNAVAEAQLRDDGRSRVLEFVRAARESLEYRAFIAERSAQIVGSASCQVFAGLYPNVLKAELRKYGYLWGVYVLPEQRRHGIATALTEAALEYLRSIGCTHALLHASPSGRPVYTALEFQPSNELRLDLLTPRQP